MAMATFESLAVGDALGCHVWTPDEAALADWLAIYPEDRVERPHLPAGLVNAAVMRAFMAALDGAPPGSIHAGQRLLVERLPRLGETLATEIACTERELRRGRRWLGFAFTVSGDGGRRIASGLNRSIFPV